MSRSRSVLFAAFTLVATLACSLFGRLTATPLLDTSSQPPTETTYPTTISAEDRIVLLIATFDGETPLVHAVDPDTGEEVATVDLPGWRKFNPVRVAGGHIFYETEAGVRRTRPGGTTEDLTFVEGRYFLPSSDGSWIAWGGCLPDPGLPACHNRIEVARVDGSERRTVFDEAHDEPLEARPFAWSGDGRHLYLYHFVPIAAASYPFDIRRIDLLTGEVSPFLGEGSLSDLGFSPDDSMVAYSRLGPEPRILSILDLASGKGVEVALVADHRLVEGIVWARDGSAIAISQGIGVMGEASAVVRVELEDMQVRTLLTDDSRWLMGQLWLDEDWIFLGSARSYDGGVWLLNAATSELTRPFPGRLLGAIEGTELR